MLCKTACTQPYQLPPKQAQHISCSEREVQAALVQGALGVACRRHAVPCCAVGPLLTTGLGRRPGVWLPQSSMMKHTASGSLYQHKLQKRNTYVRLKRQCNTPCTMPSQPVSHPTPMHTAQSAQHHQPHHICSATKSRLAMLHTTCYRAVPNSSHKDTPPLTPAQEQQPSRRPHQIAPATNPQPHSRPPTPCQSGRTAPPHEGAN